MIYDFRIWIHFKITLRFIYFNLAIWGRKKFVSIALRACSISALTAVNRYSIWLCTSPIVYSLLVGVLSVIGPKNNFLIITYSLWASSLLTCYTIEFISFVTPSSTICKIYFTLLRSWATNCFLTCDMAWLISFDTYSVELYD